VKMDGIPKNANHVKEKLQLQLESIKEAHPGWRMPILETATMINERDGYRCCVEDSDENQRIIKFREDEFARSQMEWLNKGTQWLKIESGHFIEASD